MKNQISKDVIDFNLHCSISEVRKAKDALFKNLEYVVLDAYFDKIKYKNSYDKKTLNTIVSYDFHSKKATHLFDKKILPRIDRDWTLIIPETQEAQEFLYTDFKYKSYFNSFESLYFYNVGEIIKAQIIDPFIHPYSLENIEDAELDPAECRLAAFQYLANIYAPYGKLGLETVYLVSSRIKVDGFKNYVNDLIGKNSRSHALDITSTRYFLKIYEIMIKNLLI